MESLSELQRLIGRFGDGMGQEVLSGIYVGSASAPTPPIHSVHQPVFAIVAQGAKQFVLADQVYRADAGQFSVVPVDLPLAFRITEATKATPYLAFAMPLKAELIASLLLDTTPADSSADEPRAIGMSRAPVELIDAVVRVLRLRDQPRDIPIMYPLLEREIMWRLLCSDQGALVRQIGLADSRLAKVSRAVKWIRENYAQTLRIEDLAERVAMSSTSFHRHFRAATAMSPLQYQKQIRLQEARSRLVTKPDDVASIGFSVGYESPSQFSREYARLFGAPPGRDAAGLRAAITH